MNPPLAPDSLARRRGVRIATVAMNAESTLAAIKSGARNCSGRMRPESRNGFSFDMNPWDGQRRKGGEITLVGRVQVTAVAGGQSRLELELWNSRLTKAHIFLTVGGSAAMLFAAESDAELAKWLVPFAALVLGIVLWGWRWRGRISAEPLDRLMEPLGSALAAPVEQSAPRAPKNRMEQLRKPAELRDSGVISAADFEKARASILSKVA